MSLVILTANRRPLLQRALASVAEQTLRPDELIVVENGSADDTAEFLEEVELPFPLKVVRRDGSGSYAEARNAGLAEATSELAAFLDDDCEADRFCLERLRQGIVSRGWVAAGGALLPAEPLYAPPGYAPELCWAAGLLPADFYGPLGGRRVLPTTANLMFRRELLERFPFQSIGGEAGSYLFGREDAQWWRALRRAGLPVGTVPRAIAWHHIPADRLRRDVLLDRAENDGRAHWRREMLTEEVTSAARDVVNAPINAVREAFAGEGPAGHAWERNIAWAKRQRAFLQAAVEDTMNGVPRGDCTKAYAMETARAAASVAKGGVRAASASLYKTFRNTCPLPGVARPPRRLLVVNHDLLGDTVNTLPMLRQLAEAFPKTKITVLSGPVGSPILRENVPEGVHILTVPEYAKGGSPVAIARLRKLLLPLRADVILNVYSHGLCPAALFLLSAPVVSWTHDNGFEKQMWGELVSHPVEKTLEKNEQAALLDLLTPFGIRARLERPRVVASKAGRERVAKILDEAVVGPEGYAVIHLEADARWKFWPPDRFGEVAGRLNDLGVGVFFVGGRSSKPLAQETAMGLPRAFALNGLLETDELAALLERARLYMGCDSGPAHVAQGTGCPTVMLFGMTAEHRWGPLPKLPGEDESPKVKVVSAGPGDWLMEETAGLAQNEGMRLLDIKQVVEAAEYMLQREENFPGRDKSH